MKTFLISRVHLKELLIWGGGAFFWRLNKDNDSLAFIKPVQTFVRKWVEDRGYKALPL